MRLYELTVQKYTNHFSTLSVSSQMLSLYKWLADEGDKPEFVYE